MTHVFAISGVGLEWVVWTFRPDIHAHQTLRTPIIYSYPYTRPLHGTFLRAFLAPGYSPFFSLSRRRVPSMKCEEITFRGASNPVGHAHSGEVKDIRYRRKHPTAPVSDHLVKPSDSDTSSLASLSAAFKVCLKSMVAPVTPKPSRRSDALAL